MGERTYTTPQGQSTRERIIAVAMRVFATQGFRGVPLDVIATEAAVTRQGILYHFESKAELLLAVLDQHERENEQLGAELFAANNRELIPTMRAYYAASRENKGLIRMLLVLAAEAMDCEHPGHDFFVERYRRTREGLERSIAGAQAAGTMLDSIPAHRLAAVAVAVADGLQLQEYLDEGSVEIEETLADLLTLFSRPADETS